MIPRRPWHFPLDMNGDGIFTITDVIKLMKQLFFLPGDSLAYLAINKAPRIAQFFELGHDKFHGVLTGIISFIAWVVFFIILMLIKEVITDIYKKISREIKGRISETNPPPKTG